MSRIPSSVMNVVVDKLPTLVSDGVLSYTSVFHTSRKLGAEVSKKLIDGRSSLEDCYEEFLVCLDWIKPFRKLKNVHRDFTSLDLVEFIRRDQGLIVPQGVMILALVYAGFDFSYVKSKDDSTFENALRFNISFMDLKKYMTLSEVFEISPPQPIDLSVKSFGFVTSSLSQPEIDNVVNLVLSLRSSGLSYRAISQTLFEKGISFNSKPFHPYTIANICSRNASVEDEVDLAPTPLVSVESSGVLDV